MGIVVRGSHAGTWTRVYGYFEANGTFKAKPKEKTNTDIPHPAILSHSRQ